LASEEKNATRCGFFPKWRCPVHYGFEFAAECFLIVAPSAAVAAKRGSTKKAWIGLS
jgi:hypothetical protein